ncbi:hypothetical protein A0256_17575 [Mucilaginibacter sp. PAMC 26640]|nr:hypothetical protein A0256_17575 [Mucilaginibacter sp. PAMC 26640]
MFEEMFKKHYPKIISSGLLLLATVAIISRLNNNKEAVQNEIIQELQPVGYAAHAALVKEMHFSDAFTYRGAVEAGKTITLTSETDGKVIYSAIEKGLVVTKGAILVRVDPSTRASGNQINEHFYTKAKADYLKLKELQESGNASGMEVENARLLMQNAGFQRNISKKQVEQTLILAPETGTVIDKKINQGEYVTSGITLGTMACLNNVVVNVFVQENEIAHLKNGDTAMVKADAYPDITFRGKISAIIPVASSAKTFPVEIRVVNNKASKLLSGMNVTVTFQGDKRSNALVIPRSALTNNKGQSAVYLIHRSRHPVLTPIVLGKEFDNFLSVSSGLKVGDTVMTTGLLNVEPGKKLQTLTINN